MKKACAYKKNNILHRIVEAESSSYLIFDSEIATAVLWGRPVSRGHSFVICKRKWGSFLDASAQEYAEFMKEVHVLATAVAEGTNCAGLSIVQSNGILAGQIAPHFYVEVIPKYTTPTPSSSSTSSSATAAAATTTAPEDESEPVETEPGTTLASSSIAAARRKAKKAVQNAGIDSGGILSAEEALPTLSAIKTKLPSHLCGWSFQAPTEEDTCRVGYDLASVVQPGDVIFLSGDLGSGKTCIARSLIRTFFHNPTLDVPSPSFLLCLTYAPDSADYNNTDAADTKKRSCVAPSDGDATSHEKDEEIKEGEEDEKSCHSRKKRAVLASVDSAQAEARADESVGDSDSALRVPCIHHMDPYRLRNKNKGKMAALINFEEAFKRDITLVEWPERLGDVLVTATTPERLEIRFDGVGLQGQGRWISMRGVGERWLNIVRDWASKGAIVPPPNTISFNAVSGNSKPLDAATLTAKTSQRLPKDQSSWLVLGIDTSCDDTGAAIVRGDGIIVSECIASQAGVHDEYGGVKPDAAQQAHQNAIEKTVDSVLEKAGISPSQLTAVAVTVGPGLALCLSVGVRKALEVASKYNLPIVRIHHMEAHAMVTRLPSIETSTTSAVNHQGSQISNPSSCVQFPIVTLLVSGGHNMIVLSRGVGQHIILGSTLDDSVGEAFDKVARILDITEVPGGPKLEKMANEGDAKVYLSKVSAPLVKSKIVELKDGCDFSFAGLKTNIQTLLTNETARITRETQESEREEALHVARLNIAATFQAVAVNHLVERTKRAISRIKEHENIQCLVVAGGVAANMAVRSALQKIAVDAGIAFVCPPLRLCTDNGVMIAWTGIERMKLGLYEDSPGLEKVARHVEVLPRWPLGPRDPRSVIKAHGLVT